jgi:peptidoglycan L-alanyl-D-glutamate endopeptidase CwlK
MSSRRLSDLNPKVQILAEGWLRECRDLNLDILVTCTLRTNADQDRLYQQGRTNPGSIVTYARAGQSYHNYGLALDFVPLVEGKPTWKTSGRDLELWTLAGELAEEHGFEWAGRWTRFREYPHIQVTFGLTITDLQRGVRP